MVLRQVGVIMNTLTLDLILKQTVGFSAFPVPSLTLETGAYKQGQVATGNNLAAVSTQQKKTFFFGYAVLLKSVCCGDSSDVKNMQQYRTSPPLEGQLHEHV